MNYLINTIDSGILTITLNNPDKRNALSLECMRQLNETLSDISQNPAIRTVIIQAQGPVFCAGLDLKEAADPSLTDKSSKAISVLFENLFYCPVVTICAIDGLALAGGGGIVAACDYVIAGPKMKIGFPEIQRGLIAAHVSNLFYRRIPSKALRELVLFGEFIDVQRAYELGIVNQMVEADELESKAIEKAKVVLKAAPGAIQTTKQLLNELEGTTFEEGLEKAKEVHHLMRHSTEAAEGIRAFNEKRSPIW